MSPADTQAEPVGARRAGPGAAARPALPALARAFVPPVGSLLAPGGRRARLSILIYHRVLPEPDPMRPGSPDRHVFAWQMRLLARHFRVFTLGEAARRLREGTLPPRSACITFDDGYADNREVALPVLQDCGLRATFFVAVGYLDGGRMFNDAVVESVREASGPELDLRDAGLQSYAVSTVAQRLDAVDRILGAIKALPPPGREQVVAALARESSPRPAGSLMMTRRQVAELAGAGMEIGGHTVHHPVLASIDEAEARREIAEGKRELEAITAGAVTSFAYPNGRPGLDYRAEHVQMVRDLGFEAAVSTAWGVSTPASDVLQLPRFTPWDVSPGRFAMRLLHNCLRTRPRTC